MSEFIFGIFVGIIIMTFIVAIIAVISGRNNDSSIYPPPPSEGWTYTKSTNKPDKRPVPPKPEPRLRG